MSLPESHPLDSWPKTTELWEGSEFDWFVLDRDGRLGVFTTAGSGPIPQMVVHSGPEIYNEAVAAILAREPKGYERVSRESGRIDDWRDYAERGLYAFDFYDVHRVGLAKKGGYDMICRPVVPLLESDLPHSLRKWLPRLQESFSELLFISSQMIPE